MKKTAPRKNARPLSPSEEKLWKQVTKDVAAYQTQTTIEPANFEDAFARTNLLQKSVINPARKPFDRHKKTPIQSKSGAKPVGNTASNSSILSLSSEKKSATQATPRRSVFVEGDPKIEKQVRRGRMEIDAVLDLHGSTQIAAQQRLNRFITLARHQDARCVLIITGKGKPTHKGYDTTPFSMDNPHTPRGILRMRFLEWIEQEPLRSQIIRVATAKPTDGGSGAYYVFLKRSV